jgi:hypothetical protein
VPGDLEMSRGPPPSTPPPEPPPEHAAQASIAAAEANNEGDRGDRRARTTPHAATGEPP